MPKAHQPIHSFIYVSQLLKPSAPLDPHSLSFLSPLLQARQTYHDGILEGAALGCVELIVLGEGG